MREFGPPEVLVPGEVPEPVLHDGDVAVDVELANITFVETQVRAGRPPHPSMLPALPAILGNGVAGVAVAVGRGVDAYVVGRTVVTGLDGSGGYAERAVTAAERLVEIPDRLPMRDALALLADGRTALMLLRTAVPREGETVLVEAAAGGVGTLLVQLVRNAGARVVALAGGERKLAVARALGADLAVDYREDRWPSASATAWARWTWPSTGSAATSASPRSACYARADASARSAWPVALSQRSAPRRRRHAASRCYAARPRASTNSWR